MKYIIRGETALGCLIVRELPDDGEPGGEATPEAAVHAWRNKKVEEWSNASRTLTEDFSHAYTHSSPTSLQEVYEAAQEKLTAIRMAHSTVLVERKFTK